MRILSMVFFVCFLYLNVLANVAAEQQKPALKISKPIIRSDFEDRIWKSGVDKNKKAKPAEKITSTLVLGKTTVDDLYSHLSACKGACKQSIFSAGWGYLSGHTGFKSAVQVQSSAKNTFTMALLDARVNAEGLKDAYLAIFESAAVMPSCTLPIHLAPKTEGTFLYGTWQIKAVYSVANGQYLTWLKAGGGDAGWIWSLHAFVTTTPSCELINKSLYYLSSQEEDNCKSEPNFDSLFTVMSNGSVQKKSRLKSCKTFKIDTDPPISIGS